MLARVDGLGVGAEVGPCVGVAKALLRTVCDVLASAVELADQAPVARGALAQHVPPRFDQPITCRYISLHNTPLATARSNRDRLDGYHMGI